jgi:hypothetical protein
VALNQQLRGHYQHPIVIDPDLEVPALVTPSVVLSRGDTVDPSPGAHQPLDVGRCRAAGKVEQSLFGLRGRHPSQGAHLRV